jgi:selenocysteine lyase/cysteine desulfurase
MTSIIAEKYSSQISIVIPNVSVVLVRLSLSVYSSAEDVLQIQDSIKEVIKPFEE